MEVDANNSEFTGRLSSLGSVLDLITEGEISIATPWSLLSKNSDNNDLLEYQTTGKKSSPSASGNSGLIDMKITLDSSKRLITSVSIKSPQDTKWSLIDFQYDEINDIESLKNFPMDYKKIDPNNRND